MPSRKKVPYKMRTFARGIIAGLGPRDALLESDYNTDNMTPQSQSNFAQELLNNPLIAPAIEAATQEVTRGSQMSRAELIDNLENIVNTDIADLLEFRVIEIADAMGRRHQQAIWAFKDSDELDPKQLAAISEIGLDNRGKFRLKLEPKQPARQLLAKLHGWEAAPKIPVGQDGKDAVPVAVVAVSRELVE